jgi:hypothetical protein
MIITEFKFNGFAQTAITGNKSSNYNYQTNQCDRQDFPHEDQCEGNIDAKECESTEGKGEELVVEEVEEEERSSDDDSISKSIHYM